MVSHPGMWFPGASNLLSWEMRNVGEAGNQEAQGIQKLLHLKTASSYGPMAKILWAPNAEGYRFDPGSGN